MLFANVILKGKGWFKDGKTETGREMTKNDRVKTKKTEKEIDGK